MTLRDPRGPEKVPCISLLRNRTRKRRARHLKKILQRYDHELRHAICLDLMARLHGFAHFTELKRSSAGRPLSLFDAAIDNQSLDARFQHQGLAMANAGFGEIAGALLDELNPTGRQNPARASMTTRMIALLTTPTWAPPPSRQSSSSGMSPPDREGK